MPLVVVAAAGLVGVVAWPCARGLAHLLAALDARRLRKRGRPLITGGVALAFAAAAAAAALLFTARFVRKQLALPELAPVLLPRLAPLLAPALALVVIVLWHLAAAHLHRSARRGPRSARLGSRLAAALAMVLAAATVAAALTVRTADPALVLDVWSQPTLSSEVIERVHSLENLRADIDPAAAALIALPGAVHPDVILITIDTVRADRVPPLNPTANMPALAALVARGTSFTRAFAPGTVTRRSLPSLITGLSPTRVRGRMSGWALRLDPRHVVLAERFAAGGYETAGFLCCEHFWGKPRKLGWNRGLDTLRLIEDGEQLAQAAAQWLLDRAKAHRQGKTGEARPLFLWMHFMEPHKWNGNLALLPAPGDILPKYDTMLSRVDSMLATVFRALATDGSTGRPQLIAVTSDHGEGLGEHGTPYHSTNLYNSLLQVPLIIAGPGVKAGQSSEVVGLIDVAPTLVELAGFALPPPPAFEGRSMAPVLRGERPSDDEGGYAYAAMVPDQVVRDKKEAIIRGRWKLISNSGNPKGFDNTTKLELYDYVSDPGETKNLAGSAPQSAELQQLLKLRKAIEAQSPFVPLSKQARDAAAAAAARDAKPAASPAP